MRDFKATSAEEGTSRWLGLRVTLVGGVFVVLLAGVFVRAVELQVFQRDRLKDLAEEQYVRDVEIPARRGDIFDRRGVPLAQSVEADSIWADPKEMPDLKAAARALGKKLKLDPEDLFARLSRAKRFAWIKRQVKPDEVEAVKALGLSGLGFTKEPRRFYPQRELAAQVVGVVGTDGRGLEGLELAFEDELSGEKSRLPSFRDARGRKLLTQGTGDVLDRQGASVFLTIDRQLQHVTEKALGRAVDESKAISGMAVVLDPRTGELLALANHPRFNPNTPQEVAGTRMHDRAALDGFEPGSTFKAFVVAAGLEEGAIKPSDIFFCENGSLDIGRHTIHDTHPHGWLSPAKILQVSSNIGAAKMAQVLGRERLVAYYSRFGFGERAGLALPGEGKGSVPFPKADVALATQSFGQGLTATAVQLTAAYGALANQGVLMRPFLVSKVVDPDGVVLLENRPTEVRRVVSEKTARQVISMLEGVVEKEGTAPRAKMEEYRVAGKTGTAQKVDPVAGGYSDKRIASFIGVVPAEDPRVVILVVIDEPKTDVYGGLVAAPAFKEIATAAMPYLGVPPSRGASLALGTVAPAALAPVAPPREKEKEREVPDAVTEKVEKGTVEVPDLVGKVGREAVFSLLAVALEPRLSGSGCVVSQAPAPGTRVERGARVSLELAARQ